jgi:hypothetical protein
MPLRRNCILAAGFFIILALPGMTNSVRTEETAKAPARTSVCAYLASGRDLNSPKASLQTRDLPDTRPLKVKVRHLGRNAQGKQVAESDHFRIVHEQKPAFVEKIARAAERARRDVHHQWFGDSPYEWDGKCVIYLYATHKQYVKKTKQSNALAHARSWVQGRYVMGRSVSLACDVPGLFEDVLPHEVTHSVMANRFNGETPRWADEGMAVLSESSASLEKWRRRLAAYRQKEELFDLEVLMQTEEARQTDCLEYYSQSASLVAFLAAQNGRPAFARFLGDSLRTSYKAALKKHYGIGSFGELNRHWAAYAFPVRRPAPAGPIAALPPPLKSRREGGSRGGQRE